jgi:hypothetical protein
MGFMRGSKETDKGREADRKHSMMMAHGGGMMHSEPDADDMPNTGRMGDDDSDDQGGFMRGKPMRKKRGFMRDAEMEGH